LTVLRLDQLALLVVLLLVPALAVAESRTLHEPLYSTNQYPLHSVRLGWRPQSAWTEPAGQVSLGAAVAWSSTSILRDNFVVDAESRELRLRASAGVSNRLELGIELPFLWRGGGVLDGFIDGWHKLFGLPEGGRDKLARDSYAVLGVQGEDNHFNFDSRGYGLGNTRLVANYNFLSERESTPAVTLSAAISLPTAKRLYGHNGIDSLLGVVASKQLEKFSIHGGSSIIFHQRRRLGGLLYEQINHESFVAVGYGVTRNLVLHTALHWVGESVSSIEAHPSYALYLDAGFRYALGQDTSLGVGLRENPGGGRGSTDVVFLFSLDTTVNASL